MKRKRVHENGLKKQERWGNKSNSENMKNNIRAFVDYRALTNYSGIVHIFQSKQIYREIESEQREWEWEWTENERMREWVL